jgi:hypothetical protein
MIHNFTVAPYDQGGNPWRPDAPYFNASGNGYHNNPYYQAGQPAPQPGVSTRDLPGIPLDATRLRDKLFSAEPSPVLSGRIAG